MAPPNLGGNGDLSKKEKVFDLESSLEAISAAASHRKYKALVSDLAKCKSDLRSFLVEKKEKPGVLKYDFDNERFEGFLCDLLKVLKLALAEGSEKKVAPAALTTLQNCILEGYFYFNSTEEINSSFKRAEVSSGIGNFLGLSVKRRTVEPSSELQEYYPKFDPTISTSFFDAALTLLLKTCFVDEESIRQQATQALASCVSQLYPFISDYMLLYVVDSIAEIFLAAHPKDTLTQVAHTALSQINSVVFGHLAKPTNPIQIKKMSPNKQFFRYEVDVLIDEAYFLEGKIPPGYYSRGSDGWCVICKNPAGTRSPDSRHPVCGGKCMETDQQGYWAIFGRQKQLANVDCGNLPPEKALPLILFSYYCSISKKELPTASSDIRLIEKKRFALEMLNVVVQKFSNAIHPIPEFLKVLQSELCVSLIKNALSHVPRIFGMSFTLFISLMLHFKSEVRHETGVFLDEILIKILKSSNSSYEHKYRVLQVLQRICSDAKTCLELYANFDCVVDEKDVFTECFQAIAKTAKGSPHPASTTLPQQNLILQQLALESLVAHTKSMLTWLEQVDLQQAELTQDNNEDKKIGDSTRISVPEAGLVHGFHSKQEKNKGIATFNAKASKGITMLIEGGHLENTPESVGRFLYEHPGLSKAKIGEFLGGPKPFNISVLKEYTRSFKFTEMELDEAIEEFMYAFRIPGEAQVIDRIMEQFAEVYVRDNPGKFKTLDCAFFLSFAVIMLHTDAHSPNVRLEKKLKKEKFVQLNAGINDEEDLPKEYLEDLYDRVVAREWVHHEDRGSKEAQGKSPQDDQNVNSMGSVQTPQAGKKRFQQFLTETSEMAEKSTARMTLQMGNRKTHTYYVANDAHVGSLKILFESGCLPLLAAFSEILEKADDEKLIENTLEGISMAIRLSTRFSLDTEKEMFVTTLAKFTCLTKFYSISQKNIMCIRTLLQIALSEGDNLVGCWQPVLDCVSRLHHVYFLHSSLVKEKANELRKETSNALDHSISTTEPGSDNTGDFESSNTQDLKNIKEPTRDAAVISYEINIPVDSFEADILRHIVANIDIMSIDLLFAKTQQISRESVSSFVQALCNVSQVEISLSPPRIFSLQKLVEVADCNMNRSRFEWKDIWTTMRQHFIEATLNENLGVSLFAVDSLRQLALKFLDKEELGHYHFQIEFLKPFSVVMSNPRTNERIKDLVVQILDLIVKTKASNIKSGWRTVLSVVRGGSTLPSVILNDSEESRYIISRYCTSFEVITAIVSHHLESVVLQNFSDVLRCIGQFGLNKFSISGIPEKSVSLFRRLAENVFENEIETSKIATPDHEGEKVMLWMPLLSGISSLASSSDTTPEVRKLAMNDFFQMMNSSASKFSEEHWRLAFKGVILPFFDELHHHLAENEQYEEYVVDSLISTTDTVGSAAESQAKGKMKSWMENQLKELMSRLVEFLETHLTRFESLLPEVLSLMFTSIRNPIQTVSRIGVESLELLVLRIGSGCSEKSWNAVSHFIKNTFEYTLPSELLLADKHDHSFLVANDESQSENQEPTQIDTSHLTTKCVIQLLLIQTTRKVVESQFPYIPISSLRTLISAVRESHDFAMHFNEQVDLRQKLKNLGFMKDMRALPGLIKQERESLQNLLRMLFSYTWHFNDPEDLIPRAIKDSEDKQFVENSLVELIAYSLTRCLIFSNPEFKTKDLNHAERKRSQTEQSESLRVLMGLSMVCQEVIMPSLQSEIFPNSTLKKVMDSSFSTICQLGCFGQDRVRFSIAQFFEHKLHKFIVIQDNQTHKDKPEV
eukprot:GHVP01019027.1.p1 GENE.GHVP01019027.1~~GHVP01019027.1.p1  ORF type:complete len:1779 (-),score=344.86 GHVP01019027.1:1629-6965(-)